MAEGTKEKSLARVVEDGFKSKSVGSFAAGQVTVQLRGSRVDIVPTKPIEPQPELEMPSDGNTNP